MLQLESPSMHLYGPFSAYDWLNAALSTINPHVTEFFSFQASKVFLRVSSRLNLSGARRGLKEGLIKEGRRPSSYLAL